MQLFKKSRFSLIFWSQFSATARRKMHPTQIEADEVSLLAVSLGSWAKTGAVDTRKCFVRVVIVAHTLTCSVCLNYVVGTCLILVQGTITAPWVLMLFKLKGLAVIHVGSLDKV